MANEFKIRKGLIVEGATSGTVVDVQGSLGQLFSVTDNLSGEIFAVADISGVPIMSINSNGKVGIGTTSPQSTAGIKLDVIGGIGAWAANNTSTLNLFNGRLVGAGRQIANLVSYNGNGALDLYDSANALKIHLQGSGDSYFNGGNVGIGVTGPLQKLVVQDGDAGGTGGSGIDSRTKLLINANTEAYLSFNVPALSFTGERYMIAGTTKASVELWDYAADPQFRISSVDSRPLTFATTNVEKMRISPGGSVKFNAYDSTNNTGTPTYILGTDASGNVVKVLGEDIPGVPGGSGTLNTIPLWTPNGDTLGDSVMTQSGVNIGIGTTSYTNSSGYSTLNINGTTGGQIAFQTAGTSKHFIWGTATDFNIYNGQAGPLIFYTSASEKMRILSGGNVGIGTTGPLSKLELGPNGSLGANITNKNVILNIDGGYGTTGTPSSGQYKVLGFTGTTRDVTDITGQNGGETSKNFYAGIIGGDYFNQNRFSVWQAGIERLTILGTATGSGNVGIGSTSPINKLQIGGTVQTDNQGRFKGWYTTGDGLALETGISAGDGYVLSYNRSTNVYTSTFLESSGVSFGVRDSGKFTFTSSGASSGNVGINTTNPSSKLEIAGFSTGQGLKMNYGNSSGTIEAINFQANGGANGVIGMQMVSSNVGDLWLGGSGGRSLTLYRDGNIGIGTTTPNAKLDVQGTQGQLFSVTDDLSGEIFAVADISGVPIMTVNSSGVSYFDGNVGIGDSTPSYKLDVNGNIRSSTVTVYDGMGGTETGIGASSAGGYLRLYTAGVNRVTIQSTAQTMVLFASTATGSNYMQFQNNAGTNQGYLGYGSGGNDILYIVQQKNADIQFYNGNSVKGSINTAGTLTMGGDIVAYGSPSDKRLKENIKPIESALDKVSKLQGVTFDWKDKKQEYDQYGKPHKLQNWKNDIGFIAQEVQKVIPELVRENEDGMLSMRHQGIAPILLEAIKELKAEIEELKKKIK